MDNATNSRTMTMSIKVTPYEKMSYSEIAKSHDISLSEWAASLLNIHKHDYGKTDIEPHRELHLLTEIERLKDKIKLFQHMEKFDEITKDIGMF